MSTTNDAVFANVVDSKPATKSKKPKEKKVPAPKAAAHPSYYEMIKEAIATLAERTGSSQHAITKYIEENQKNLPSNFRKLLLVQLRKLVTNDKLVKIKGSYKLPKKPTAQAEKPKPKAKAADSTKEKKKPTIAASKAKPTVKVTSAAAKPKAAVKAKSPAAKATVAAKAAPKRKAPEKSKKAEKKSPAKVARTSTRSAPGKKAVVKAVKPKTVKSPVKKAAAKGKK